MLCQQASTVLVKMVYLDTFISASDHGVASACVFSLVGLWQRLLTTHVSVVSPPCPGSWLGKQGHCVYGAHGS
jgi:hypothetical protein